MVSIDPEERAANVEAARRAFARYTDSLRRLGAVGEIGVGYDDQRPPTARWWARCVIGSPLALRPRPLLVEGHASGLDALAALCDRAAMP